MTLAPCKLLVSLYHLTGNFSRPDITLSEFSDIICFYLPPRRSPGTGDIDVFSRNFAGTRTMSWGCVV